MTNDDPYNSIFYPKNQLKAVACFPFGLFCFPFSGGVYKGPLEDVEKCMREMKI